MVQRSLYDALAEASGRSQELLAAAVAEAETHALALEEMAEAERSHGYVSRSGDVDPWLARVREAVAEEARTYGAAYPEGAGAGLRYTAFERHARVARQTVARLEESRQAFAELGEERELEHPYLPGLLQFRDKRDIGLSDKEQKERDRERRRARRRAGDPQAADLPLGGEKHQLPTQQHASDL